MSFTNKQFLFLLQGNGACNVGDFLSEVFIFLNLSAGATGAERGGAGVNREAGSGVEEHPVSDGEEDAQS